MTRFVATYNWRKIQFIGGIDNLFDKTPLVVDGSTNIDTNVYDFLGRYFYVSRAISATSAPEGAPAGSVPATAAVITATAVVAAAAAVMTVAVTAAPARPERAASAA